MGHCSATRRIFSVLMSLLLLLPLAATADNDTDGEKEVLPFSDLSFPEPARHFSATQKCVLPEAEMRKNHMKHILHQRDETVHRGVRTRKFALEECVNCHVNKDTAGDYIPVNDPGQFCYSCHSYAAVKIDCFECHATRPMRPSTLQTQSSGVAHSARDKSTVTAPERLASEGPAK